MSILKFNNKVHYIHNSDFKTILIKIMFPFEITKENLAFNTMLPPMLSYMTKNYPNEQDLIMEKKKRYLLSSYIYNSSIGLNGFLCYDFTLPDNSCLNDNYFESQFELMEEIIYNPKVINNSFDKTEFERELKNLELGLDSIDKNMRSYQHTKLLNLIDDEGILSLSLYNNRDLIENVNASNLYDYYKSIIKNTPFIFVFGDLEEDEFNKLFNKYIIKNNKKEIIINDHYNNYLNNYKKEYSYYEEKKDFKDSSLSVVYKIKDFDKDDIKYLYVVKGILNSLSTRLLDNKLRDKHDLVYGSRCCSFKHYGLFEITAFINKNNKNLVFEKILEVMNEIKNEEYIKPFIDKVIEGERISLLKRKDLKYGLFDDFIFDYLKINISKNELYKSLLNIKSSEVVNFINRFIIDTVYFLEEGDNND